MKVRELIELLSKQDPELRVIIDGYEGGYSDVEEVEVIKIALNVNPPGVYGVHDNDSCHNADTPALHIKPGYPNPED